MSGDLENKSERPSRKNTDYVELTEHKNLANRVIQDVLPDESGQILWPSFIKDHGPHLWRNNQPFELEQEGNFIVVSNSSGCRVFDTSLQQLEPVLIIDEDLIPRSGNSFAEVSTEAKYVLVKCGLETYPADWSVKVFRVAPEGGDQLMCELKAADISEDIPEQAACDASWVTPDCFLVYCYDEGTNYGSKWVFQMSLDDDPHFKCVIKCPMKQVWDDSASTVRSRITEDQFYRERGSYFGLELVIGLATKPSCWEIYAVQEDFRPLGTLCPFGNERNLCSWKRDSSRYVAFFYLDDNESNREICVYDFGSDPKNVTMTLAFKAPLFPGESYQDVHVSMHKSASTTLLQTTCTAEGKEVMNVYDLKREESKLSAVPQRRISMAAMEKEVSDVLIARIESCKDEGCTYGKYGSVPDYLEDTMLLGEIFDQLPPKYIIILLHNETSVSVYDIENRWEPVIENFCAFGETEKLDLSFSKVVGAPLATRPHSNLPCVLLLFPNADTVKETRQHFKLIDLANKGNLVREEKLEFHECFLTPKHTYVICRFHLNFTIFSTTVDTEFERQQKTQILDWDFKEGSEVASSDILREVSPDDRFLAVGARHQIRIFELAHNNNLINEAVAIIDFSEGCKELSFRSCLPVLSHDNYGWTKSRPPNMLSYWDHLYYEDAGKVWVRYEQQSNRFVVLHKIDESKKELIYLSKTLMLAVQPVNESSWEPQSTEGESLAVLRVDLDLQNVLDLSTLKCNVSKIGDSQRVLVSNKMTLRVLDFTIADRLVDSLTLFPDCSIISLETASQRESEMCAMILNDVTLRAQQLSIVIFKRTGPEVMDMPEGGLRFAPFGGKKFSLQFLPSYNPTHILLVSVSDEISIFEIDCKSNTLAPVKTVQNYVLPSKYDDSVSVHEDVWLEISLKKGIQMINLTKATSEDGYNPRDHYLQVNTTQGFHGLNDNVVSLVRDNGASVSIYELQDDSPVEVFALSRICDIENKLGAPEIDISKTTDGRFLLVQNSFTFGADCCFVLVYDLKTKSKKPILRKNYGQTSNTNFNAFFPYGSCIHLIICTPGGKNVEVYDMFKAAKNAIEIARGEGKEGEPDRKNDPIFTITVDSNDFLKCSKSDSFCPRIHNNNEDDENSLPIKEEEEDEEKKALKIEMTDEQKDSKTIFYVTQKSNAALSFYFLTSTTLPYLLRTMYRPFNMLETTVNDDWPWVILNPTANDNQCKVIKIVEKKGKLEMTSACDYSPYLNDYTEIKKRSIREHSKASYLLLTNATAITVHVLGEDAKEIFKFPCDTNKTSFDFCSEDNRALLYTTGSSTVFLLDLLTGEKHKLLPSTRRNEKLITVYFDQSNLIIITTKAVLIFEYKEGVDPSQSATLIGEIDVDPTWPTGSWSFDLRLDNKLAIITRNDYCACLAIYRNVRVLETDSENTTRWPLLDVPIDQKTDPEWANAQFKYAGDFEYVYCYSPQKRGITVVDLSRAIVPWYPIITWSSTENVLKYDLARSLEQMPNVDRFLQLYKEILVGPMSPKDPLSAINHLCSSSNNSISDGRHRALNLFLSHMPKGTFELTSSPVPAGEKYPRARRTVLGSLIAKKDWMSISILLEFLVAAAANHRFVPLSDNCLEFGFELVDLAYKHSPLQVARFLKDFALQKLPLSSPVVTDAVRNIKGVDFGKSRFLTCGSEVREPNKLWSMKLRESGGAGEDEKGEAKGGGDRYDVCYVAIPGLSCDGTKDHPKPVFHQLVQVAQDTSCAELIANPALEAIIDFKWRVFARTRFMISFGLHLFATFCVILFCSFLPLQDRRAPLWEVGKTQEGALCIVMLIIFSVYAIYNTVKEARELAVQTPATYIGLWNLAANLQSALLITTAGLYLSRSQQTHFVAGASVLICHIYILFYLQALETTGPLIRMILQITSDMKYFTGVLFLCLLACTFFYIVVTEGTGIGAGNVAEVWLRMYMTFFFFNFESDSIDGLETSEQITISYLMIVGGSMFVAIVLLNLLIALMGDSFAAIKSRDTLELQLLRAGMVRDIEFTMTIKTAQMVKERFPRWIHCLLPLKEHQARETNETLTELRNLKLEMAKLEERLEHMTIPGGYIGRSGSGNQRRGSVLNPTKGTESRPASVVASKRASVASQNDKSLDDLLRELQNL